VNAMRFQKGEIVRRINLGRLNGRIGMVVGFSGDREKVYVVWRGNKSADCIHHKILVHVTDEDREAKAAKKGQEQR
jgi:hypothetical protein